MQTFNFVPYRVDLTPFAGVLSNGQPHQVGVSVIGANNYFLVAASLLLYLDHGATHVTGALTANTLGAAPHPTVSENLTTGTDGSVTGSVTVKSTPRVCRSGVRQHLARQGGDRRPPDADLQEPAAVHHRRQPVPPGHHPGDRPGVGDYHPAGGSSIAVTGKQLSFPFRFTYDFVANPDGTFAQTATSDQKYNSQDASAGHGLPTLSSVSNHVASTDTQLYDAGGNFTGYQNRNSSQTYTAKSLAGGCYSRTITAANAVLTSVTDGQDCH